MAAGNKIVALRDRLLPETLLVWRQDFTVFHRGIAADEEALLPLLTDGCRFEIVCERLPEVVAEEIAVGRAFDLLGRWVSDGLIAAEAPRSF